MANSFGKNPIVLDTFSSAVDVGDTLFSNSNAQLKVELIVWEKPTSTDHTLAITDGAGSSVWECKCVTANDSYQLSLAGQWIPGLKIAAEGVGSGKVKIFLSTRIG